MLRAISPDQCLLLTSSESLMSLREQRVLFRVLSVPASVRPAGYKTDVFTHGTTSLTYSTDHFHHHISGPGSDDLVF